MGLSSKDQVQIIFVGPRTSDGCIGAGILSACLKRRGFYNIRASSYKSPLLPSLVRNNHFTVLAFSTCSQFVRDFIVLSQNLKKRYKNIISVFGGPHPTFLPEMIEQEGVDAICRGEGEEAFVEFVSNYNYAEGKPDLTVRNWWVKDKDNRIHKNELRPLILDLDKLPLPDRRPFLGDSFSKKATRRFVFSRGCSFDCTYCCVPESRRLYGASIRDYYRIRSPENSIREIKDTLQRYGGSIILVSDSIFGLSQDWLEEFSFLYKYEINLPLLCNTHPKIVTEKYADLLKEAGCYFVIIGLETGNDEIRKRILSKNFDNETLLRTVSIFRKRKIKIGFYNMIGIPGTSIEDDLDTLHANQLLKSDFSICNIFNYFPGTQQYQEFEKKGVGFEEYKVICNLGFQRILHPGIQSEIVQFLNLQCLFNFCVYAHVPRRIARMLIKLPLRPFYKVIIFFKNCRWLLYTKVVFLVLKIHYGMMVRKISGFFKK